MSEFTLLNEVSEKIENISKSGLNNLFTVTQGIVKAGTTNLNIVKNVLPDIRDNKVRKASADYKFLTRFFDQGRIKTAEDEIRYNELMVCIQTLCWLVIFSRSHQLGVRKLKYLLLDGTKWEIGNEDIHLMTLCVLVADVAIPVWWEDLQKAGHSSQKERINMLKSAMKRYNFKGMTLLADREYHGVEWFKYLIESKLDFVIRVKEGIYHDAVNQAKGPSWEQLKKRASKKASGKKVSKRIELEGISLHYIVLKNPRPKAEDELIFLISSMASAAEAAKAYAWRWHIEVCFKYLKSGGINLEHMNVAGKKKRHLMMAIAVLCYCLVIREGLIKERKDGIRWVKDKASGYYYRAISVYKKGLEVFCRIAKNYSTFIRYLQKLVGDIFPPILQNV